MRLDRFQQSLAAIQLRRFQDRRERAALISWQTRITAQYTAAGYMVGKGSENKPLEHASTLGFDEIERVLAGGEQDSGAGPKENKPGSYERFMGWASEKRMIPEGVAPAMQWEVPIDRE